MEMIIEMGFKNITHSISFNESTLDKGKLLIASNHVCKVQELRNDGISFLIRAFVIRQTSVSNHDNLTKINP